MNRRTSTRTTRFDLRKALKTWLMQHLQACIFSMGQLFKNPVNSLLTTAVVGIALALPAGFYLLLENCQRVAAGWDDSAQISLFLNLELEQERALSLAEEIRHIKDVKQVDYVSPEAAMLEYQQLSGIGDAEVILGENPLPAILLLQPQIEGLSSLAGDQLLVKLRALPEVDTAEFDRQWIQRLFAIIDIIRQSVSILSVLLVITVLLIVGNTIRQAIYSRREEIEVHKLFGATEAFIQRPFLYSGLFHGIGGGLMAWGLLSLSLALLDGPALRLAKLYSSNFSLNGLSASGLLLLLAGGASLGLVGSWLAVQRHIRAIEPG